MLSQPAPSFSRLRDVARGVATLLGRWALGEPAVLLSKRNADLLAGLQFQERLRRAEGDGDHATLDRELARVQLTSDDLARLSGRATPLADWPDEDADALFAPSAEPDLRSPSGAAQPL